MGKVRVEIWAWPPIPKLKLEKAKEGIIFEEDIYAGISALDLFNRMALNRNNLGEFIFDKERQSFNFHVLVTINEKIVKVSELAEMYLKNGDRIVIIPLAGGG